MYKIKIIDLFFRIQSSKLNSSLNSTIKIKELFSKQSFSVIDQ